MQSGVLQSQRLSVGLIDKVVLGLSMSPYRTQPSQHIPSPSYIFLNMRLIGCHGASSLQRWNRSRETAYGSKRPKDARHGQFSFNSSTLRIFKCVILRLPDAALPRTTEVLLGLAWRSPKILDLVCSVSLRTLLLPWTTEQRRELILLASIRRTHSARLLHVDSGKMS